MGSKSNNDSSTVTGIKNHWSNGLLKTMNDPESKVLEDDLVVIIKDMYPKAMHHFLVCPKADLKTLKDVKPKHLQLIKHMAKMGEKLADSFEGKNFLIGFHAIPSMSRLHLHVISDDFDSKFLKTKKHWNSFNTSFFIPSDLFIKQLESGKMEYLTNNQAKELMDTKLKCHKCNYHAKNMPDLKNHILKYLKSVK